MKQTTSQIQKKIIIIITLALVSIITKAQSQTDTDYTSIALAETEEDNNTVALETSAVNISSSSATGKILEIGKTYIMENNTSIQETTGANVMASTNKSSPEWQETSDDNFLYALNTAIEETKRAKIENTYLRLIKK